MFKTTVGVDGMMCGMCEAHMNNAVRSNFKVKKVESSHAKGLTVIVSSDEIDKEKLAEAVSSLGYKITSFESETYQKKGFFSKNK